MTRSRLGFGIMRLPRKNNKVDMEKAEKLILSAIDQGVNYFDTAYLYFGTEQALGEILEKHNKRSEVNIATKIPPYLLKSKTDFDKYFTIQTQRLKTDYLDYYMLHMVTDAATVERVLNLGLSDWVTKMKSEGKIKNFGFSYHGNTDEYKKVIDKFPWDFSMIQYNLIDENSQAGRRGMEYAYEKGIPVFVMEPLRGGRIITDMPKEIIAEVKKTGHTMAEFGLRWLFNQKEVSLVLSGMRSEEELLSNLNSSKIEIGSLTEKELSLYKRAAEIWHKTIKVGCTGCNYCMPCPHGVDIPACFAAYNDSYLINRGYGIHTYVQVTGSLSKNPKNASRCTGCNACVSKCPQKIKIPQELSEVSRRLEGVRYKIMHRVMRFFMK